MLKNYQNTHSLRFSFITKTDIAFPKTGVLFSLWGKRFSGWGAREKKKGRGFGGGEMKGSWDTIKLIEHIVEHSSVKGNRVGECAVQVTFRSPNSLQQVISSFEYSGRSDRTSRCAVPAFHPSIWPTHRPLPWLGRAGAAAAPGRGQRRPD